MSITRCQITDRGLRRNRTEDGKHCTLTECGSYGGFAATFIRILESPQVNVNESVQNFSGFFRLSLRTFSFSHGQNLP